MTSGNSKGAGGKRNDKAKEKTGSGRADIRGYLPMARGVRLPGLRVPPRRTVVLASADKRKTCEGKMRYLSVFNTDQEVLKAFSDIHLKGKWYELDCTFSKGVIWEGLQRPTDVSDIVPLFDWCVEDDSTKLENFEDNALESIVFDPPFLFRDRKAPNNDKMSARFSYFESFFDLILMYRDSLECFYRKLKPNGYAFFKCQDMTDGKFYATHCEVINMARALGFDVKDIAIKVAKTKLQKDAKQQNCVAKVHSYWIVLKKGRAK
jgi:hypothetical protein